MDVHRIFPECSLKAFHVYVVWARITPAAVMTHPQMYLEKIFFRWNALRVDRAKVLLTMRIWAVLTADAVKWTKKTMRSSDNEELVVNRGVAIARSRPWSGACVYHSYYMYIIVFYFIIMNTSMGRNILL
jgi:hypothetical protein